MKAVTIRLDENVITTIEEYRGLKPRADFIRDIIDSYFLKSDSIGFSGDSQAHLNEIANLKKELQYSEIRISDLLNQVSTLEKQVGFLQLEYQKLSDRVLLPAPTKSWWKFWQR